MSQSSYDQWKKEEDARKALEEKRLQRQQDDLMSAFDSELGLRSSGSSVQFGDKNNQMYDINTGEYSVRGDPGKKDAFWWNPKNNISAINGVQLSGMLDPRIALGIDTTDYASVDQWYANAQKEVDAAIQDAYNRGSIVPGYTVEDQTYSSLGNEFAKAFGAETTPYYKARKAAGQRTNESTIDEYLKRSRPDVYDKYKAVTSTGDTFDKDYVQRAYDSALSRNTTRGPQEDFYSGLKSQFDEITGALSKPESYWDEKWKQEDKDMKMNEELNAIYKNPTLQGYSREAALQKVKDSYITPIEQTPSPIKPIEDDHLGMAYVEQQKKQNAVNMQAEGKINSSWLTTFESNNPGKTLVLQDGKQVAVNKADVHTTTPTYDYAESMQDLPVSPASPVGPEPTSEAMKTSNPWSKEFETSALNLMSGYKTSLDDYIKTLGKPVASTMSTPKFSLSSNALGETGTRNSGLVSTTPKPFQDNSSYTGKAGPSTSTNQQALWR